ncbi:MAG: hypothetical protein K0R41_1058 [Geminicoccaceae bacterium]|jgi:hypothetical protein|nr:hypothetical protein [Geminicoccaceae bacterium]
MATKRVKRGATPIGISAAALEAWRIGDWHAVNRALNVAPCEVSPFDADTEAPPEWARGRDTLYATSWARAWQLRCRLIAAGGQPGHHDRHGQPLGPSTDGRPGRRHDDVPPDTIRGDLI